MKKFVPRALCAAVLLAGLVGGPVGAQAQVDGQSGATVTKVPKIIIQSYSFTVPKRVAPGATVRVVNRDQDGHTVTSDDGKSFDLRLLSLEKGRFKAPMKPGSYPFRCIYHSSMRAVLVVK